MYEIPRLRIAPFRNVKNSSGVSVGICREPFGCNASICLYICAKRLLRPRSVPLKCFVEPIFSLQASGSGSPNKNNCFGSCALNTVFDRTGVNPLSICMVHFPKASPIFGGTAFPICSNCESPFCQLIRVFRPLNSKSSGKLCRRAASRAVRFRFSQ